MFSRIEALTTYYLVLSEWFLQTVTMSGPVYLEGFDAYTFHYLTL